MIIDATECQFEVGQKSFDYISYKNIKYIYYKKIFYYLLNIY